MTDPREVYERVKQEELWKKQMADDSAVRRSNSNIMLVIVSIIGLLVIGPFMLSTCATCALIGAASVSETTPTSTLAR